MTDLNPSLKDSNPGDSLHAPVRPISDTPRTDQNVHSFATVCVNMPERDFGLVTATFARDLERELHALHRWQSGSEREIKELRAKYTDLLSVSQALHDHLWKNVGDNADWPLEINAATVEDANELKERLETLRIILSNEQSHL